MDEIKQVITASSSRKHQRSERTKAEDFDAEEGELLKEENEQEEEVFNQVCYTNLYVMVSGLSVSAFYIDVKMTIKLSSLLTLCIFS